MAIPFGQAGIMSLGYAGLMGFGAYTAAILVPRFRPEHVGGDAVLGSGRRTRAGLFGLPSLRISGHHFAITTYVMCELLRIALINGGKFTGAASGLDLPPIGTVLGIKLDKLSNAYMLVAGFMFISMLAAYVRRQFAIWPHLALHPGERTALKVDRRQHQHGTRSAPSC